MKELPLFYINPQVATDISLLQLNFARQQKPDLANVIRWLSIHIHCT